jgi:demethylmenaquinone methyltransferase/2-methoxy-6-polyprenyl-1,4-benzoquinol methylase
MSNAVAVSWNQPMITTLSVKHAYDRTAPFYDLMNRIYFLGKDKRFRSSVVNNLDLTPDSVVLNPCCGTGLDFPYLRQEVDERGMIVGVDLSIPMLHRAKKKGFVEMNLVRADIAHLPFRTKVFDAIMVSFCLKITPLTTKSINELARVLQTTGKLGILANHKPNNAIKNLLAQFIGAMAKIDFTIDLEQFLSTEFTILEKNILYSDLVQVVIGESVKKGT